MRIKICGITNIEDAEICTELGADALGFIFYKKSKRYIDPYKVKSIISMLPPFINKVGVFVNEEANIINTIAKDLKLSSIQLHGDESAEIINYIDYPVIKAFRVDENFDYKRLNQYKDSYLLLDTFHQHEYGGTGEKFNWDAIPEKIKGKIILAGGVSVNNLEFIYNKIRPYAVDISSSIELEPGKKDHDKVKKLFKKYNDLRNTKC